MSLTPAYTCKLCRRTLTLPPGQIIGEKPQERYNRASEMLSEHFGTEHKQEYGFAFLTGNALTGLVVWTQFQHNDKDMLEFVQRNAAGVRRFTSKPELLGRWRITDAMIESIVNSEVSLSRETVIAMLKSMRDQVDEAPEQPPILAVTP